MVAALWSGNKIVNALARKFKRFGQLAAFLVGVALVVLGIWQVSRPVGYMAAGLALGGLAILSRLKGVSDVAN